MVSAPALPNGWAVWNEDDDGRLVAVYRPDVFDGEAFPAACLPTLYLTHGRRTRRPGRNPTAADDDWYVTLYLEPDVSLDTADRFSTRNAAMDHLCALARAFDAGDVAYRSAYQLPRDAYLDRLDELTGAD